MREVLKQVRGKKAVIKMESKLKEGRRVNKKNKHLEDMEKHFEKIGIQVDKDNLKGRSKSRKSIKQLEEN